MQAESSEAGQVGCLVEHVKVSESELLLNVVANFKGGHVLLSVGVILANLDSA